MKRMMVIGEYMMAGLAVGFATMLLLTQIFGQGAAYLSSSARISSAISDARAAINQDMVLTAQTEGSSIEFLFAGRRASADPINLDEERRCLAQAIYFEARSEPFEGWIAVADVVLNRARDPRFPASICGVVFQGEYRRHRCQFSFACDGRSDVPYNRVQWERAQRLAAYKIANLSPQPMLTMANHYHADYVSPKWSEKMVRLDKIGRHIFYSDKVQNN